MKNASQSRHPSRKAQGHIVTGSPVVQQLLDMARRIAPSDATVLIQGESGTGKELLARYIHDNSKRSHQNMVAMNCAALPEQLAESELFGYEKGAFTGAVQSRPGRFEAANGGTLLLDEISEMQLPLQAKLLRVLQERQVDPVGARQPLDVDVRIIATTNRNLASMASEGTFRLDLYYRLRVIPITVPPLRERPEDIPPLIDFFTRQYCPPHLRETLFFKPKTIEAMQRHPWPGNVRELENTVQRALLMTSGPAIEPSDLFLELPTAVQIVSQAPFVGLTVKELEKRLIEQTLGHVNQNRTQAAKMLGISIRTLRNKLHEFNTPEDMARSAS